MASDSSIQILGPPMFYPMAKEKMREELEDIVKETICNRIWWSYIGAIRKKTFVPSDPDAQKNATEFLNNHCIDESFEPDLSMSPVFFGGLIIKSDIPIPKPQIKILHTHFLIWLAGTLLSDKEIYIPKINEFLLENVFKEMGNPVTDDDN